MFESEKYTNPLMYSYTFYLKEELFKLMIPCYNGIFFKDSQLTERKYCTSRDGLQSEVPNLLDIADFLLLIKLKLISQF